jgi:hypothetical protein
MFTTCGSPILTNLPQEAETYVVEIGKGTPLYMYLDDDYTPILDPLGLDDPDPGKTAVLIDDNPMAEGVLVMAETFSDETDSLVRIINKNNDSSITMFFQKDKQFPWAFDMKTGSGHANARLSTYNNTTQQFSVTFEENGEYYTLENITLNKGIFTGYNNDPELSSDQNARLRNIYIALGIYVSINQQFPESENIIALFSLPGWLKSTLSVVSVIFQAVAIVACAVAIVIAAPIAVGSVTFLIPGVGSFGSFVALGVSIASSIATIIVEMLLLLSDSFEESPPTEPQPQQLSVTIKNVEGPNKILVNPDTIYYPALGETLTFELSFTNYRVGNTNVIVKLYDPFLHAWEPILNAHFFKFSSEDDSPIPSPLPENYRLNIYRENYSGTGYNNGTVDLIICFNQPTVVNNSNAGLPFHDPEQGLIQTNYVFPIHLGVTPPSP